LNKLIAVEAEIFFHTSNVGIVEARLVDVFHPVSQDGIWYKEHVDLGYQAAAVAAPLAVDEMSKALSLTNVHESSIASSSPSYTPRTRWEKIQEVIWGGGNRTPAERKLVQRLDLYVLSWATFGYFIRLLDSTNISEFACRPCLQINIT
jgi:hypothetical protein